MESGIMYDSKQIVSRIKFQAKRKGVTLGEMLTECGLGINTIGKMGRGCDILTHNFAKIADYLDCSVDYLLGRTDNPDINR